MGEPIGTAAAANSAPVFTAGGDVQPTHAEQLVMSIAPVMATVASLPTTSAAPWYKSSTSYSQILASAAEAAPGVLAATRASQKTAAQVQLGFMLASLVLSMFHRNAPT